MPRRSRDNDTADNALDAELTMQQAADAIYGKPAPLDTGRVVAKPIPIMEIWPDVTQPRRVFPASVRGKWNGDPAGIPDLIEKWQEKVTKALKPGERLYAGRILRMEDYIDLDKDFTDAPG